MNPRLLALDIPEDSLRLAIVGSRYFRHPDWETIAANIAKSAIDYYSPALIISGGAVGVDSLAEHLADELEIPKLIHHPQVKRFHGPGGYRERDGWIARDCTHLLAIRCAHSKTYGSGWTADEAERLGKVVHRRIITGE